MSVERLLQVHLAVLAVLGAVMLGLGLQSVAAPVAMVLAAIASLWLTDVLGVFRLRRIWAELGALAALLFVLARFLAFDRLSDLGDFLRNSGDSQLAAVARLLIFLHILFLFREKNERVYRRLFLLSMLEIVSAAGMDLNFEFGLLMMAFLAVGFFAAALFFLYRSSKRFESAAAGLEPQTRASAPPASGAVAYQHVGDGFLRAALPGGKYLRHLAAMAVTAMTFAAVFFCSAPRTSLLFSRQAARRQVGFTRDVSLDQLGPLLSSDRIVMRVAFQDPATRKPFPVHGEFYMRGISLSDYVSSRGSARWMTWPGLFATRVRLDRAPSGSKIVREEISLEPTERPELFGVFPVRSTRGTPAELRLSAAPNQLCRSFAAPVDSDQSYHYAVATTGFLHGVQSPLTPQSIRVRGERLRAPWAEEKKRLLFFDAELCPSLAALADQVVREEAAGPSDSFATARALETHFRTSGRYIYATDNSLLRSPDVDPLEDFIANHHAGHCEYFASALVLMLRSQGVPARLVVGYKGGEFNSVGGFYVVRDLHAHAWAEVFLAPDQIPPELLDPSEDYREGAWLRLDPTPATGSAEGADGLLDTVDESFGYAQALWKDYVLRLDSNRQRSLLRPLWEATAMLFQLQYARTLSLDIGHQLALQSRGGRGVAAVFLALAALAVTFGVSRRLRRRRRGRRSGVASKKRSPLPPRLEFYRRLERLLARYGLRRNLAQTPREFAASAAAALTAQSLPAPLAQSLLQIVEAHYSVRFGAVEPGRADLESIDEALRRLDAALKHLSPARTR